MVLLIDNYDSFVYNLARYIGQLGYDRQVVRNDKISMDDIKTMSPTHIIISPGPCSPFEAGNSLEIILNYYKLIPILGICLGHQAIAQAFGGVIQKAQVPMHGKASYITHNQEGLFKDIKNPFKVGRYHSLIVETASLPDCLEITAVSEEQEIMGLRHKVFPTYGLQFHPEAILTEYGYDLLNNFLRLR